LKWTPSIIYVNEWSVDPYKDILDIFRDLPELKQEMKDLLQ
jgi:hypothetical protein